ncbi:MAG: MBL fold metallo-hydrolase [Thermodesulfobacteriota bacterium]
MQGACRREHNTDRREWRRRERSGRIVRANGNAAGEPPAPRERAGLRITFLGTRGGIDARSPLHRSHAALLVARAGRRVMVDCGADWAARVRRIRPDAIVLTHAHPDHVDGLRAGAPCPVSATRETWRGIPHGHVAPRDRRLLVPGATRRIAGVPFVAFRVEHSLLAPAVGLRVGSGRCALIYVPDVVSIPALPEPLRRVALYVGDGASITRGVLRGRGGRQIGHASIRTQLAWCAGAGVARAIFTHCGTEIVAGGERAAARRVRQLGEAVGVEATIARDGLTIDLTEAVVARSRAVARTRSLRAARRSPLRR